MAVVMMEKVLMAFGAWAGTHALQNLFAESKNASEGLITPAEADVC